MYEHQSAPLLPRPRFLRRLLSHLLCASVLVAFSLLLGTLGYHGLGRMPWIDAFLNAAMLLGGMGQVGEVTTGSGKVFAALFALYAGLVLISVATIILAPLLHRILHTLHLDEVDGGRLPRKR